MLLWTYSLGAILHGVHVSKSLSPTEADQALEISLALWDLSPTQAKKLIGAPLTHQ